MSRLDHFGVSLLLRVCCVCLFLGATAPVAVAEDLPLKVSFMDILTPTHVLSRIVGQPAYTGFLAAIQFAKEEPYFLPGYNLSINTFDTEFDVSNVVKYVTESTEDETVAGIVGPATTIMSEYALDTSRYYGIPHLIYASASNSITGSRYPNKFRTVPTYDIYAQSMIDFIIKMGWKAVSLVSSEELSTAMRLLRTSNDLPFSVIHDVIFRDAASDNELVGLWKSVRDSGSRVTILTMATSAVTRALSAKEGITADDHVFLMPTNLGSNSYISNPSLNQLTQYVFGPIPFINTSKPEFIEWNERFKLLPNSPLAPIVDYAAGGFSTWQVYSFEATWSLLLAINATITDGYDPRSNHSSVIRHLNATDFVGPSGPVTYHDGDKPNDLDWVQIVGTDRIQIGSSFRSENGTSGSGLSLNGALRFPGTNSAIPPLAVYPDSCGITSYRHNTTQLCVSCNASQVNDPNDGLELCALCPLGSRFTGTGCELCPNGAEGQFDETGIPVCVTMSSSLSTLQVLAIVAAVLITLAIVGSVVFLIWRVQYLRRRAEKATSKAKAEASFVAFVFHELRNPINGVMGYLEIMEENLKTALTQEGIDLPPSLATTFSVDERPHSMDPPIVTISSSSGSGGPTSDGPEVSNLAPTENPSSSRSHATPIIEVLPLPNGDVSESTHSNSNGVSKHSPRYGSLMADSSSSQKRQSAIVDSSLMCLADVKSSMSCCRHAVDVLNNVLDLSKFTFGKLNLKAEPVDVASVCHSVMEVVKGMKPQVNCVVDVQCYPSDDFLSHLGGRLYVLADRQRLTQVLINLASNAMKFTDSGYVLVRVVATICDSYVEDGTHPIFDSDVGMYTLSEETERKRQHRVSSTRSHDRTDRARSAMRVVTGDTDDLRVNLHFEVVDTGVGISKNMQGRLFKKYEHMGVQAGTGLGLILSQSFVNLMGGKIEVESPWSETRSGAKFFFDVQAPLASPIQVREASSQYVDDYGAYMMSGEEEKKELSATASFRSDGEEAVSRTAEAGTEAAAVVPRPSSADDVKIDIDGMVRSTEEDNSPPLSVSAKLGSGGGPGGEGELSAVSPHASSTHGGGGGDDFDGADLSGFSILVCDDLAMNRKVIVRKLKLKPFDQFDFVIEQVKTGEEALDVVRARETSFDLIVMDQIMNSMGGVLTGTETTVLIREWEKEHSLKPALIISCSGNAMPDDKKSYLAAGMNHSWSKPMPSSDVMYKQIVALRKGQKLPV